MERQTEEARYEWERSFETEGEDSTRPAKRSLLFIEPRRDLPISSASVCRAKIRTKVERADAARDVDVTPRCTGSVYRLRLTS